MAEPDRNEPHDSSERDDRDPNDGATLGVGMAVGIAIGASIGVATDNVGLWLPLGVAFGAGIGYWLEQR